MLTSHILLQINGVEYRAHRGRPRGSRDQKHLTPRGHRGKPRDQYQGWNPFKSQKTNPMPAAPSTFVVDPSSSFKLPLSFSPSPLHTPGQNFTSDLNHDGLPNYTTPPPSAGCSPNPPLPQFKELSMNDSDASYVPYVSDFVNSDARAEKMIQAAVSAAPGTRGVPPSVGHCHDPCWSPLASKSRNSDTVTWRAVAFAAEQKPWLLLAPEFEFSVSEIGATALATGNAEHDPFYQDFPFF